MLRCMAHKHGCKASCVDLWLDQNVCVHQAACFQPSHLMSHQTKVHTVYLSLCQPAAAAESGARPNTATYLALSSDI